MELLATSIWLKLLFSQFGFILANVQLDDIGKMTKCLGNFPTALFGMSKIGKTLYFALFFAHLNQTSCSVN